MPKKKQNPKEKKSVEERLQEVFSEPNILEVLATFEEIA